MPQFIQDNIWVIAIVGAVILLMRDPNNPISKFVNGLLGGGKPASTQLAKMAAPVAPSCLDTTLQNIMDRLDRIDAQAMAKTAYQTTGQSEAPPASTAVPANMELELRPKQLTLLDTNRGINLRFLMTEDGIAPLGSESGGIPGPAPTTTP
jgi:hypothetical protein